MEETKNVNEELEVEQAPESQANEKKLSKKVKLGIIIGAASAVVVAIVVAVCIIAFGGKPWQELYDNYLVGKTFESDGRTLTFDENDSMTYEYKNGIGNTYRYIYSIVDMEKEDDKLVFSVEQVSANRDDENIDEKKQIKVVYYISKDEIEYYSCKYKNKSSSTITFDTDLYDDNLKGKTFESDGRLLIFSDNDYQMVYNFKNGSGDTYRYTYSIIDIVQNGGKLILTLKQIASINNNDSIEEDEPVEATYYIASNRIVYYSLTYNIYN